MLRTVATVTLALLAVSIASGMGTERFDAAPLNELNYTAWPRVMPVVNDTHRVYQSWVNGNEHFYFAGDTAALNAALTNFANVKADRLTVVLRPGPGRVGSFNDRRSIACDWQLHLLGGISRTMAQDAAVGTTWDPCPTLTVYVGGAIKLDELDIPAGIRVLEVADLERQYTKCLASSDQSIRGWSCLPLAQLDRYDAESLRKISSLLESDDAWVKLNAAGALAQFTGVADEAIAKLQAVKTNDDQLRQCVERSIDHLQQAKPDEAARREYQETLAAIHAYVTARQSKP